MSPLLNSIFNERQYQEAINESTSKLVVIGFIASWCESCRSIAFSFNKLSHEFPDVAFFEVDVDEAYDVTVLLDVRRVPTFRLIHDGEILTEVEGTNIAELKRLIVRFK